MKRELSFSRKKFSFFISVHHPGILQRSSLQKIAIHQYYGLLASFVFLSLFSVYLASRSLRAAGRLVRAPDTRRSELPRFVLISYGAISWSRCWSSISLSNTSCSRSCATAGTTEVPSDRAELLSDSFSSATNFWRKKFNFWINPEIILASSRFYLIITSLLFKSI